MLETLRLQRLHVGPIDLQAGAGTCVAIEGRSGSGKSVLLRMIADLDPHAGDAALDGEPCSRMPAPRWRQRVTYVAAATGWWYDTVAPHFEDGERLRALLPRVGLPAEAAGWEVARLSTGERQRIALLRALTPTHRVLLLDEPTSGLDAESTAQVEALLHDELARGTIIVMVTHDPGQAGRLAHQRYLLADGRLHENML
ncbi:MAG TPA: ATP-binding cassette domain-containing protein [Ramlibacter sp.]|uniref:ABC transporter ATP-binding protein n=1 Tax=Ramlibacter sp. TaxID=1917967 RepID=UPI002D7F8764|nr:ATP-binding cassette domain-containing protein [Ramlibacter sp.]HET8748275.1 ATP-binding cassette domain-containing protein [Ramlibacter sp.]